MAQEKKSFILYLSYRKPLSKLSYEEKGKLLDALFAYADTHEQPDLDGKVDLAFAFIQDQMERDNESWKNTLKARSEAGKEGGKASAKRRSAKIDEANPSKPKQTEAKPSKPKQTQANEANACFACEIEANEAVDVDVNVDVDVDVDNTPPAPSRGEAAEEQPAEEQHAELEPVSLPEVPVAKIMELYNHICVSYPKIRNVDGQRRKAVTARWRTYPDLAFFQELFKAAESSDFLKGQNDRNWTADFDWMIKPTNMCKVLEGKYNNDRMPRKGGGEHNAGYTNDPSAFVPSEW
jgi:hypothetical protein